MRKDTWIIIGVMVALVGLLATFMVTGLASIESRLTAMDNHFSGRLAATDTHFSERLTAMDTHFSERLTAMDTHFSERLAAMDDRLTAIDNRLTAIDGRLHDVNTRLSRIEGHLGLPTDIEPIRFETIGPTLPTPAINLFEEDGRLVLEPVVRPVSGCVLPPCGLRSAPMAPPRAAHSLTDTLNNRA